MQSLSGTILALTPESIKAELANAGAASDAGTLQLQAIRRNPDRRDYLTRAVFRIDDGQNRYHLTIGPGLEDLWKRSQAFAEACPEIAIRPLFFHRAGELDYLGMEYIEGETLEDRILNDGFSADQTLRVVKRVIDALEKTFTASTTEAAQAELESWLQRICTSPMFSGLDQRFLRELVFPFIRAQAMDAEPVKRWSNGDFIAKNIVIDGAGNPYLIDYEFARQTHFYGEDAWRWRKIADIPPSHRLLPPTRSSKQPDRWLEALFLLNQIVIAHEINGAAAAVTSSSPAIDEILRLISETHGQFRNSVFYRSLGQAVSSPDTEGNVHCQLFWSVDGNFSEEASQRFKIPTETDATVHFRFPCAGSSIRLRFDPVDAIGLVRINGIRVRIPQTRDMIAAFSPQTGWDMLTLASGVHRLVDTPELNFISLNDDPILFLPPISSDSVEGSELLCEVDFRFTRGLERLPALMQGPPFANRERELSLERTVTALQERTNAAEAAAEALGTKIPQLEANVSKLQDELSESLTARHQLKTELETLRASLNTQLDAERENNTALRRAYSDSIKRVEHAHRDLMERVDRHRMESESLRAENEARVRQLASALAESEQKKAYFEDKYSRMSKSFSWRATSPLRFLRRTFLDPLKAHKR